jgi:hypothetical protein
MAQYLRRAADVDHDADGVKPGPPELDVDDQRRAVEPLGGPEHLARVAVGHHHVIADGNAVHQLLLMTRLGEFVSYRPGEFNSPSHQLTKSRIHQVVPYEYRMR